MFRSFLNSRSPSILTVLAFVGCCLKFCNVLAQARDSAQLTPEITKGLVIWGVLALVCMLAFCLVLARVTRYRRSLPDKVTFTPFSK
jgi:hypothetical protein